MSINCFKVFFFLYKQKSFIFFPTFHGAFVVFSCFSSFSLGVFPPNPPVGGSQRRRGHLVLLELCFDEAELEQHKAKRRSEGKRVLGVWG